MGIKTREKVVLAMTLCGIKTIVQKGERFTVISFAEGEARDREKRNLVIAWGNINVDRGDLEVKRQGLPDGRHFTCPFCDLTEKLAATTKFPMRKIQHDEKCLYQEASTYSQNNRSEIN